MKSGRISIIVLSAIAIAMLAPPMANAQHWPAWRGAAMNGISDAKNLPSRWGDKKNVRWRIALPGPAPSTPAIWGNRIFLTAGVGEALQLLCYDLDGKQLWNATVGEGNRDIRQGESNAASPSPVTDGKHVWAFFGTGDLVCYTVDGKKRWQLDLEQHYGDFSMYWGMSTSPLLHGKYLYMQLLHSDAQAVFALDKQTGKEIWRIRRKSNARTESLHSYASPILHRGEAGEHLVVHGSDYVTGHQLKDGAELWRRNGFQSPSGYNDYFRFVASPVSAEGLLVVPSAKNGPVLGLRPNGGDANEVWKLSDNTPDVPSPLIHNGLVYLMRENGVLLCLDAKTGEQQYRKSLYRRRHRSSPLCADGKIFLVAADGVVHVIKPGRKFKLIGKNNFEERIAASPVAVGESLYFRTNEALYAISHTDETTH